jgi:hypothetical protein
MPSGWVFQSRFLGGSTFDQLFDSFFKPSPDHQDPLFSQASSQKALQK